MAALPNIFDAVTFVAQLQRLSDPQPSSFSHAEALAAFVRTCSRARQDQMFLRCASDAKLGPEGSTLLHHGVLASNLPLIRRLGGGVVRGGVRIPTEHTTHSVSKMKKRRRAQAVRPWVAAAGEGAEDDTARWAHTKKSKARVAVEDSSCARTATTAQQQQGL